MLKNSTKKMIHYQTFVLSCSRMIYLSLEQLLFFQKNLALLLQSLQVQVLPLYCSPRSAAFLSYFFSELSGSHRVTFALCTQLIATWLRPLPASQMASHSIPIRSNRPVARMLPRNRKKFHYKPMSTTHAN